MKQKEVNNLKNEIAYRDVMTKKMLKRSKTYCIVFLFFIAITLWGFLNLNDPFFHFSNNARNIIKWIALIVSILSGILCIMYFTSFRHSRKYVLMLIDKLENNKNK